VEIDIKLTVYSTSFNTFKLLAVFLYLKKQVTNWWLYSHLLTYCWCLAAKLA